MIDPDYKVAGLGKDYPTDPYEHFADTWTGEQFCKEVKIGKTKQSGPPRGKYIYDRLSMYDPRKICPECFEKILEEMNV